MKPVIDELSIQGLKPPVLNASILEPDYKPVLPYYNPQSGLVPPYPLGSVAPFQSTDKFRFVDVSDSK
jgi:hypothetical protein